MKSSFCLRVLKSVLVVMGYLLHATHANALPNCQGEFVNFWSSCVGKQSYIDGGRYEGEYVAGKRDGKGIYHYPDGTFYDGYFSKGHRDGYGALYQPDASFKSGIWKSDQLIKVQREWSPERPNNAFFLSLAKRVAREIRTIEVTKLPRLKKHNDQIEFVDPSLPYCATNMKWQAAERDMSKCFGIIFYDHLQLGYVGEFEDGKKHGYGAEFDAGIGWRYVGQWKNDHKSGHGRKILSNSNWISGEFDNGKLAGQGKAVFSDGSVYLLTYVDDKPIGRGQAVFPDGSKYQGEFDGYIPNGRGVMYSSDGQLLKQGEWRNGELVFSSVLVSTSPFTLNSRPSVSVYGRDSVEPLIQNETAIRLEGNHLEQKIEPSAIQKIAKPQLPEPTFLPRGKRVALVIGNAKYKFNPLNNPVNDATDMAASLRSVGFDVIEVKDATLKQMREATRRFADKLEVSDVGLVYYSGHGIEVKGKNYLIPVNADIRREYEVVDQAFDASNLLRMMESLQSNVMKRVNILIVDACRNNDLPKSWRSTNSGLARMDAPAGSFISFATAPGQVASDGQGRNSPYTKHLLNALKQPNVPIEQVFKQVRRNVMDETGGEQVPWENSSLIGDFYFTVKR
ncbi:caspase family protein [Shewanella sp.]|uniref:caspase family protein n=1 Tax=Shewanella sp. TaxID=50422 RepID=UPI004047EE12